MNFDYIAYRKTKRSGKYKLLKRTEKIIEVLRRFKQSESLSVLDIGAADGFMLNRFKENFRTNLCLGIEPVMDYIKSKSDNNLAIIQAVAEDLPFKENLFDAVTAASVLDHLCQPTQFLKECRRVLKDKGIVIISLVSPFYDKLAVGLKIKENDHKSSFSEEDLERILTDAGFSVLEISRFALPFFGVFKESFFESLIKFCRLKGIMFYIVAVARITK